MINYEPKRWFQVVMSFHGSVWPQVLGRVILLSVLTLVLWGVSELAKNYGWFEFKGLNPLGHTVMGVAVGLLIVFRNNCSYDRYWEGRKLWGVINNASRNLVRGAAAFVGPDAGQLQKLVAAYPLALKQHLRGDTDLEELKPLLAEEVFERVSTAANPPSIVAFYMTDWIHNQVAARKLDLFTSRMLESYVAQLIDCQGGCERILKTPIPFAYAVHIKQLMMLYLFTLPFVLVPIMGWLAFAAVAAITFGLLGIEEAGVEIEDPFGDDPNDLPIESICGVIARDTGALAELPKKG